MLPGRYNAPRALGCRSPWAPLKHTNPLQTILRVIPLCFTPLPGPR